MAIKDLMAVGTFCLKFKKNSYFFFNGRPFFAASRMGSGKMSIYRLHQPDIAWVGYPGGGGLLVLWVQGERLHRDRGELRVRGTLETKRVKKETLLKERGTQRVRDEERATE